MSVCVDDDDVDTRLDLPVVDRVWFELDQILCVGRTTDHLPIDVSTCADPRRSKNRMSVDFEWCITSGYSVHQGRERTPESEHFRRSCRKFFPV